MYEFFVKGGILMYPIAPCSIIIFVERRLETLRELKERLVGVAQKNPETMVIIQADANSLHGRVVEVMDIAKTSGLNRLAIATQPKEEEGENK